MMTEIQKKNFVLKHSKSKQNGLFPEATNASGKMTNPLCGDHVEFRLQIEDDHIVDVGFRADACAICSAASSLVSIKLKNVKVSEAMKYAITFEDTVASLKDDGWPSVIDEFKCFEHLRAVPSRRVCAILPWVAIRSALKSFIAH